VGIQPHDESAAHGQTYARAAGVRLAVGNVVRCQRLVGTPDTPGEIVVLDVVLSSTAGEKVVGAADLVDNYVNVSGDVMTGALGVNVDATVAVRVDRGATNVLFVDTTNGGLHINNGSDLSLWAGNTTNRKFYVNAIGDTTIAGALDHDGTTLGFYGAANVNKQTVSGSRGGNVALTNLLSHLATYGLIINSTVV